MDGNLKVSIKDDRQRGLTGPWFVPPACRPRKGFRCLGIFGKMINQNRNGNLLSNPLFVSWRPRANATKLKAPNLASKHVLSRCCHHIHKCKYVKYLCTGGKHTTLNFDIFNVISDGGRRSCIHRMRCKITVFLNTLRHALNHALKLAGRCQHVFDPLQLH